MNGACPKWSPWGAGQHNAYGLYVCVLTPPQPNMYLLVAHAYEQVAQTVLAGRGFKRVCRIFFLRKRYQAPTYHIGKILSRVQFLEPVFDSAVVMIESAARFPLVPARATSPQLMFDLAVIGSSRPSQKPFAHDDNVQNMKLGTPTYFLRHVRNAEK